MPGSTGSGAAERSNALVVTDDRVRALIHAQLPELTDEPIARLRSSGTVNAIYRVGDHVGRFPLMRTWGDPVAEAEVLRTVGPQVTARVPEVYHVGAPDEDYDSPWLLCDWIVGDPAVPGRGELALADDLATVLEDLAAIDPTGVRPSYRVSLASHDAATRDGLAQAADLIDSAALEQLWEICLAAPAWADAPRWVHSDLLWGNLLVTDDRLVAILDWEAAGVGDPAVDLMAAWSVLTPEARTHLRARLGVDDAMWLRGRGWALAQAAIALPYYRESNPPVASHSVHVLRALVADEHAN